MRTFFLQASTGRALDLYTRLMYRIIIPRINRIESTEFITQTLFKFKHKNKIALMYKDPFIYLKPYKKHLELFRHMKVSEHNIVCPFDNAYQMVIRRPIFVLNRKLIVNLLCNKIYPKFFSDNSLKDALAFNHYFMAMKRPVITNVTGFYLLFKRAQLNKLPLIVIKNLQRGWVQNYKPLINLNTYLVDYYEFTQKTCQILKYNNYLTEPCVFYKFKNLQSVLYAAHRTRVDFPKTLILSWLGVKYFQKINYPLRTNPYTYIFIQTMREGEHH
jgi:hypothetical protein